jgi:ABC-type multidrug transport system fused ATPase/permease subunit
MIKRLFSFLTSIEQKKFAVLMGMILVVAFLDTLGVASILPFVALLSNPSLVETNVILNTIFKLSHYVGIYTIKHFLFAFGIVIFLIFIISLAFKALTNYLQVRFTLFVEYSLSKRLIETYLQQPYSWFLNRHSADLGKNILSEVNNVVGNGIMALITLITQIAIAIALIALLVVTDPFLSLVVGSIMVLIYLILFSSVSFWLKRLGKLLFKVNKDRFTIVSNTFSAIKEIKVDALEQVFVERYAKPAKIYSQAQATSQILNLLPRFIIEGLSFGGILLLILYLMSTKGSFESSIPIIALYTFAAYRLLPAFQQIYGAFSQIRLVGPAIENFYNEQNNLIKLKIHNDQVMPLPFTQLIQLHQINYSYPNSQYLALKDINLNIPAYSKIGFVGTTGSGKTTIVDIIMGLLKPNNGNLKIDGQVITEKSQIQWLRSIGYVPQQIFLTDESISNNIAFGVDSKDIIQENVEKAAKIANLHDFIINDLPQGYNTIVGERGIRLSGGQRQRIGIARALYQNPKVLIFDEATSALDNLTEQAVIESLNNLGKNITVIMIAHRISTLRNCDKIYLMERGEVKASGTFSELLESNQTFKAL